MPGQGYTIFIMLEFHGKNSICELKGRGMGNIRYFGFLLLVLSATVSAEGDPYALSLEQLMTVPVAVSSRKALSQRETPGIVTVISGEEIRDSGARDLIDVLRQVPGFDFRMTINNGIGLGMRGQIGMDGRVLMLVDGIDVNEHRYGSTVLGQGFPIEQISRIEIVRGSALALYGGSAELGVINIITRSADELNGVQVGAGAGLATGSGVKSREFASLMAGKGGSRTVKWTAMAHLGKAIRSDRTYYDLTYPSPMFPGALTSFDMKNDNGTYLGNLNVGLQAGDFSARFLHDESRFDDRDGPGFFVRAADSHNWFYSDSLLMQYKHQLNDRLTAAPNLLYQNQDPRKTINSSGVLVNETKIERLNAKIPLELDAGDNLHLSAGLEYLEEEYLAVIRNAGLGLGPLPFDSTQVASVYTEALWYNPWGNLTASGRLDEHSHAGLMRAERLGYTRVFGDWHVKLMGSHATRAPSMEDYSYGLGHSLNIIPETSRTWEMETGYRVSPDTQLTVNLYDVTTFDTLILGNREKVHTKGLEAGYQMRKTWGYAEATYSYYDAAGTQATLLQVIDYSTAPPYQVVDNKMNQAFAAQKLTANLHYKLSATWSINPSLVYLGSRWGYVAPIANATTFDGTLKRFGPTPLLNVALHWDSATTRGLDLTLGLYNALNKEVDFIQPFDGGHAPLPGMSRELLLQGQYKF